jgi:arylsulfatase A-like enzyme
MIALTYGMITHVDTEIGRVLAALRETGQDRNTIIVFTGDHGDMMGDHGLLWKSFFTFAGCIRIPLIVTAPGLPGGRVSDALTSQIDLFPGVLDLAGVPAPGDEWGGDSTIYERGSVAPLRPRPGLSWRPVLEGRSAALHPSVVIENDDPTTGLQARALVTPTHRLTVYPGTGEGELFDLAADPGEHVNRWLDCPDLKNTLTAELLDAYSRHTPAYPIPAGNA